ATCVTPSLTPSLPYSALRAYRILPRNQHGVRNGIWSLLDSARVQGPFDWHYAAAEIRACLFPLRQILKIDAQLLALLVEMTALQSQRLGSSSNVPVVPLELRQYCGAFKGQCALRQGPGCIGSCV